MSANESIVTTPVKSEPKTAKEWLDALCSGACDQGTFLLAVTDLSRKAPDACWEVLSLLDQYYRRGKIDFEVFQKLESHLQSVAVGAEAHVDISVPLPAQQPPGGRLAAIRPRPTVRPAAVAVSPATPASTAAAAAPVGAITIRRSAAAVGDVLRGRYRLERIVGKGGTGTVFEAVDQYRIDAAEPGQRLALKVLHPEVAARPELFAELRLEFQHLQWLSHPNVVRVHEFDRDGDIAFFTMELLSGYLLSHVLELKHDARLDRSHAFAIIRGMGDALVHAHSRGVVHGDISPRNIFITNAGEVRVLDFGASRTMAPGPWISGFGSQAQSPVATPRYASCQLLEGQRPDARDDLYALACVAYVLLAGSHPFKDHTAVEARTLHLKPRRPAGLSGGQWHALRAGLAIERERRPADLDEWLRRLDPRRASRRLPALSVIMNKTVSPRLFRTDYAMTAATVLVLAALWWATTDEKSPADIGARFSAWAHTVASRTSAFMDRMSAAAKGGTDTDTAPAPAPSPPAAAAAAPPRAAAAPVTPANTVPAAAPPAAPPRAAAVPANAANTVAAAAVSNAAPAKPGSVPLARIEFAADTTEVQPGDSIAQIVVRRKGYLRSDATFTWWTESGTAKPGTDFVAVSPRVEHIEAGKDRVTLSIPVVFDPRRKQPANFYAVIDEPGPGAALGPRSLAMVSILPP
jgi:protein kinase-like protein/Calx-beta domain-containing protein